MSKNNESIETEFKNKLNSTKILLGEEWSQTLGMELIKVIGELRFYDVETKEGQIVLSCAKILIEEGVDLFVCDKTGFTALSMASMAGNKELVELIIQCGININQENLDITPLMAAIISGNYEMVKFLVEIKGSNINLKNCNQVQAIDSSTTMGINKNIIKFLLENGATITKPITSLKLYNAFSKDLEMFKLLVQKGMKFFNSNIADKELASYLNTTDLVETNKEYLKLYIKMGSAFNTKEMANEYLKLYFNANDVDMVKHILMAKCFKKTDKVVYHSFEKTEKLMVINSVISANVNLKDEKNGDNLLQIAVKNNNLAMVKVLIEFGANYISKNSKGENALCLAKKLKFNEIEQTLSFQMYKDTHHYKSENYVESLIIRNVTNFTLSNEESLEVKICGNSDNSDHADI